MGRVAMRGRSTRWPCPVTSWARHLLLREDLAVVEAELAEGHPVRFSHVALKAFHGGERLLADTATERLQEQHFFRKIVVVNQYPHIADIFQM